MAFIRFWKLPLFASTVTTLSLRKQSYLTKFLNYLQNVMIAGLVSSSIAFLILIFLDIFLVQIKRNDINKTQKNKRASC